MSNNVFTLDALYQELEREYAPLVIPVGDEEYVLQSLMRVSSKTRQNVIERFKALGNGQKTDEDGEVDLDINDLSEEQEAKMVENIRFILASVTKGGMERGMKLMSNIDPEDLLAHVTLLKKWQEATQPGEASNSPS